MERDLLKESSVKMMIEAGRGMRVMWLGVLACAMALALPGCDTDSFMDPSVVGRWENTPVVLPILDRLEVIEEPADTIAGLSEVRSEDLIPEVSEYILGPGDLVTVTVFELIAPNVESVQTRRVDELGYIRLPVIGQIKASGLTTRQLEQKIIDILDPAILRNPMVSAVVQEGRQKTFNVIGAVGAVGTYSLVKSDFRLLDAIALARGIPATTDRLYIIRQVSLSDVVERGYQPEEQAPGAYTPPLRATGAEESAEAPTEDPGALIERLTQELEADLDQEAEPTATQPEVNPTLAGALEPAEAQAGKQWMNVDGQWVQVSVPSTQPAAGEAAAAGAGTLPPPDQLVTQRVIEVDAEALMRGDATQNIVIRPGDIIRVPVPAIGNIYLGGPGISRPGTYGLPPSGKLTLKQAMIAAGGLSPVAIPERVDLVRRVGPAQEAIVRLNLRAIFEGVQPDIFLKPDDTINVGTNIFAQFAAVIRNSFRMTYGFGFILDRNFGSEVFGPLPEDQR